MYCYCWGHLLSRPSQLSSATQTVGLSVLDELTTLWAVIPLLHVNLPTYFIYFFKSRDQTVVLYAYAQPK